CRQKRPVIRAPVIAPAASVHELDPKTTEEAAHSGLDPKVYSDWKRLRGPLPSIIEGAVVETVVEVEDTAPILGAGMARRIYLSNAVPTQKARVVIEAPAILPLHYSVRMAPGLQPRRTDSGDRVKLVFETGPWDAAKPPPPNL